MDLSVGERIHFGGGKGCTVKLIEIAMNAPSCKAPRCPGVGFRASDSRTGLVLDVRVSCLGVGGWIRGFSD